MRTAKCQLDTRQASAHYTSKVNRRQTVLLVQPGICANLGPAVKRSVETGNVQRRRMTDEHLARKVYAQTTVLQTPLHDATLKQGALTSASLTQLVATATTRPTQIGIALAAVPTTDGCHLAPQAFTVTHILYLTLCLPDRCSIDPKEPAQAASP